jgi:hypothetical protein
MEREYKWNWSRIKKNSGHYILYFHLFSVGRAIAQAVSRWPRVEPGSGQVGFVMDKVALGQVFSEYFGFPCQSSFHQILHHHNHPGQLQ